MTTSKRASTSSDLWDSRPSESTKAFQAFTVYRDLSAGERSLSAVSQRLEKNKSLCARWSTQFQWVERTRAWDAQQDKLKRQRTAAEREKILERQMQHNRIASQALMAPIIAIAKRAQTGADPFAGVPATQLIRYATQSARVLSRIHEDERRLAGDPEPVKQPAQLTIEGATFTWVESSCECGHQWGLHDQSAPPTPAGLAPIPCTSQGCRCENFVEKEEPDED